PASAYTAAAFEIVDSSSGAIKWSFTPWQGTFSAVALGDLDGNGGEELVAAANDGSSYGTVAIFDAATGAGNWQSSSFIGNANDPFYISTAKILLAPHKTGGGMDVVLAGTSIYSGRITVFDGASHAVKLQIGAYASGPMDSREVIDAALVDYDN